MWPHPIHNYNPSMIVSFIIKAKILKQTLLQDQDDMKVESTVSISKMQGNQSGTILIMRGQ